HSIRYVGGADLWSTSRIVPAQPPSGMSGKSGSVVPGFTRTCAPAAKRAGVRGSFSFLLFLLMAAPPVSLLVIFQKEWPTGQAPQPFSGDRDAQPGRPQRTTTTQGVRQGTGREGMTDGPGDRGQAGTRDRTGHRQCHRSPRTE